MSRGDRLSALVEELRAVAPQPRSARWLARRFEVSTRTVERDVYTLQGSGVPIYAVSGRAGGYVLDRSFTLHPLNVTPAEAAAMSAALHALAAGQQTAGPLCTAARSALRKLAAVAPAPGAPAPLPSAPAASPAPPAAVARALNEHRVLRIGYADGTGSVTERAVEPMAYAGQGGHGYLLAWCRLREAPRVFRTDRLRLRELTDEPAPPRDLPTPRPYPQPTSLHLAA